MTNYEPPQSNILIRDRSGRLGVLLDAESGLLTGLLFQREGEETMLPVALRAVLVTEGDEVFAPPRSFGYEDTVHLSNFSLIGNGPPHTLNGPEETYAVTTEAGEWTVVWEYTFRQSHPRLEMSIVLSPARAGYEATLRDVRLELATHLPDLKDWRVEAPGNHIRPGVRADAIEEPIAVSPAGGLRGSTGLVAFHQPEQRQVFVVWPFSRTEIGDCHLVSDDEAIRFRVDTGLAGRISTNESLRYESIQLDVLEGTWESVRESVTAWFTTLGVSTPHREPAWIETASIFEVQIGHSVFWEGYRYEPYSTARDLLADLGRIKGLGYDALQIMPRQPYPSYNVHEYADITTSYGDEEDLRAVVDACHSLGMRVILDILLHGVIDQEMMSKTAERVRSGPYFARLAEDTSGAWGSGQAAIEAMNVAWSRHILDFEPHWYGNSPPRHPLADEHPDWFMRDSEQNIIGIYTKAFDVANLEWQEYFCRSAEEIVRRLDIDGFRFDAPTYNDLPNWSKETESRASYSPLGCLQLFDRLRPRLKGLKYSFLLYTEPSGVLFRQAMDVTYNYDEQWLIPALLGSRDERSERTSVRSGRELAAWFRERNAVLPDGSLIAHHVDSHDTFWWPLPGNKWRREQYGIEATKALLAVFALSGGAYMTFVGGEEGIEKEVRRVHRLRKTLPEVGYGTVDYDAVSVDQDAVYAVVRRVGDECSVLLVNLSDAPVEANCTIDIQALGLADNFRYRIYDAWSDLAFAVDLGYASRAAELRRLSIPFEAYQPRLLVLRRLRGANKISSGSAKSVKPG